jgi:hypothetical protein
MEQTYGTIPEVSKQLGVTYRLEIILLVPSILDGQTPNDRIRRRRSGKGKRDI